MYGRTLTRTFSSECESAINRSTVAGLTPAWFFKTAKTVTASPVVANGTLLVGDWSGTMYALSALTGEVRWTFTAEPAPGATFGPIVSSAAVAEIGPRTLVVFGAGPRVYALDAHNGRQVWSKYVGAVRGNGRPKLNSDPAEVESSPAIWKGTVYVGMDLHGHSARDAGGARAGLLALDAATGTLKWKFHTDLGDGCGGVWSSPAVSPNRGSVYFGSSNCSAAPNRWTPHVEAINALDANTGDWKWSFQPHPPNRSDWDFGATPNVFVDPAGRPVVGAGNKDGFYYAVTPNTGKPLWRAQVAQPGDIAEDTSVGGFIGSSAIYQGRVFGSTAIGGPPYFHAIDGESGQIAWRGVQAPSYGASAAVNGVVFSSALDSVLRAYDADSGRVLWAAPLSAPSSSGAAVVSDTVYVGSGTSSSDLCEKELPGSEACAAAFDDVLGQTGGVHAFRLAEPQRAGGARGRLYVPQGNQLDIFDLRRDPPTWRPFIRQAAFGGKDLNGQVCTLGPHHILLGEDSGQTDGVPQGWGVFDIRTRKQVGKLIARYPAGLVTPEPHGCAIERDSRGRVRRIFVSQVGSGNFEAADGQLIVFYPSSPALDAVYGRRSPDQVCPRGDCSRLTAFDSHGCELHRGIRAAGSIALRDGDVYVPEFAPLIPPAGFGPGRVLRFRRPFPRSALAGCRTKQPDVFLQDPLAATPAAIAAARDEEGNETGNWYVSSVIFPPVVNEYTAEGAFVRNVLPPGFATPFGLAVGSNGDLYVADLGLNVDPTRAVENPDRFGVDTADGEGSVLRIRLVGGALLPPEYLKTGLDFPDGVGLVE